MSMRFPLRSKLARFFFTLFFALLTTGTWAQQQDYSQSAPIFPNVLAPYGPRHVSPPNLANSPRIDQLIRDGKLMLSLDDSIALALENNLDLVIARYNLPIADTDILRTKSGASVRGVNTGILSGTPGGGVGSIGNTGTTGGGAGGTSAAAGGAGTGTSGLVSSTLGVGPPIDSYDPAFTTTLNVQHSNTPQSNEVLAGVPFLLQNTANVNFGYVQGFSTGTELTVSDNNSRVTTNSARSFLVPLYTSGYLVQFRQHLLQGLSRTTNRRFIIIARNNREIADIAFRQQVIFTVTQIENLYWNLVSAYQDFNANQRALTLAQQLEQNNRRQLQEGTMAMLDVINAQAQVATANQNLIISQTNLQLQQLLMKNALTRNENDPLVAAATVVTTDQMIIPANEPVVPIQDLINEALQNRPELAESRIDLTNRQISKTSARNALLPVVDLVANYGGSSIAGTPNPLTTSSGVTIPTTFNGGISDAFTSVASHPTYFVGFNVNIPIRNRAAQADQVRSELEFRQAQVRLQQIQNEIAIDVRNAQFALQQNRARVNAAIQGRDYAAQVLNAEQKKLAQGISTTFNVAQDLSALATAESNLVNAMSAYEQSRVQLDVVTGRTLQALGIDIADAETGSVTHMPHVPNVVPAVTTQQAPNPTTAPMQPPQP
jgi:outer membrane protein